MALRVIMVLQLTANSAISFCVQVIRTLHGFSALLTSATARLLLKFVNYDASHGSSEVSKKCTAAFSSRLSHSDKLSFSYSNPIAHGYELNLLIDLYKEVMEETINPEAAKDATGARNASVDIKEGEKPSEQRIDMKPPPGNVASAKPEGDSSQKQQAEDDGLQVTGSYVVGGSAFGWNFITYTSGKSMYYGQSKESFRSANVKSE
ncbi:hypothetical protein CQW23_12554 [Capsicum baccatum]|uniref:Uncharacterized protein n=1 Tax=Capsicum baccatum TaxID=33114 RepID=A0A2G2WSV5_CAPBA|nr:hypothetical protein CQW23_12554 [Capsicum baccatum]